MHTARWLLRSATVAIVLGGVTFLAGCSGLFGGPDAVVDRALSPDLREQIDRTIQFDQIRESPQSYAGRVVMWSGIALTARRAKDRTEIEILQLPREDGRPPVRDRTQSQGRFLAIHPEFLDPAKIEPGLPLTVVGEIKGSEIRPLDDGEYAFPVLELKQVVTWDQPASDTAPLYAYPQSRPFVSPYHWWGPGAYYFGPFGPYPTSPYTNPAACPFCFYPPGGPYLPPPPR